MNIVWFLLGLLFTAIIYFRLSKRMANLNLELSEGLKGEIISLITEFNHTAERNITLIEERSDLAKNISKEIAEQLSYMKKLKEALEKEIKEAELKLKNILSNEKASFSKEIKVNQSVVAKAYEALKQVHQKEADLKIGKEQEKVEPNVDLSAEKPFLKEEKQTLAPKEEIDKSHASFDKRESERLETLEKDEPSVKERVYMLKSKGASLEEIVKKTGITRGEVELILKFF